VRNRGYQLKAAIQYYISATSRFNLHSPFLHDFAERVLRPARKDRDSLVLQAFRKQLYQDSQRYQKQELGAKPEQKKPVKVGKAARNISIPKKYGRLLSNLTAWYASQEVLELGTGLGMGTAYLMEGLARDGKGQLTTLEGCSTTLQIAQNHWQRLPDNWPVPKCYEGAIADILPTYLNKHQPDFVFLDAHHEQEAVLHYANLLMPAMAYKGVMVLDDIHWSADMASAWSKVIADERIQMSVDLFRLGIAFTDPGLSPVHLKLRF
jgi:predicted O-methyltransferase YrrM